MLMVGTLCRSRKSQLRPYTKYRQDLYVSQGTEGHGIPTVAYVSSTIGGLLGGAGAGLAYYALMKVGTYPYAGATQLTVDNLNLVAAVATRYWLLLYKLSYPFIQYCWYY